jgi:hypothetical protein
MKRTSSFCLTVVVCSRAAERNGQPIWRASVESAQTGERRTFADLAALWVYLAEQIGGDGMSDERLPTDTSG